MIAFRWMKLSLNDESHPQQWHRCIYYVAVDCDTQLIEANNIFDLQSAVAQRVEQVVHWSQGRWFEALLFLSTLWSVLGHNTEPQIITDGWFLPCVVFECVCVNELQKLKCFGIIISLKYKKLFNTKSSPAVVSQFQTLKKTSDLRYTKHEDI